MDVIVSVHGGPLNEVLCFNNHAFNPAIQRPILPDRVVRVPIVPPMPSMAPGGFNLDDAGLDDFEIKHG